MTFYQIVATPLGDFILAADERSLCYCGFLDGDAKEYLQKHQAQETATPLLENAAKEIKAYFRGDLQEFSIPYNLEGTDFRIRVWQELTRIPYGETISYRELACRVGNPRACRAVGQANHHNPLSIIIPCHRVIGKGGELVGYGGGLEKKAWLLNWEKQGLRR